MNCLTCKDVLSDYQRANEDDDFAIIIKDDDMNLGIGFGGCNSSSGGSGDGTRAATPQQIQFNVKNITKCVYHRVKYDLNYYYNDDFCASNYIQLTPIKSNNRENEIKVELTNVVGICNYIQLKTANLLEKYLNPTEQKLLKTKNNFCVLITYKCDKQNRIKWKLKPYFLVFEYDTHKLEFESLINDSISKLRSRPKSLAVFINPISGNKKAIKLYYKHVAPIFELARIETFITVTQRADHASQMISELNLDIYDGIISVGGDGLFSEIFNSLLVRTQKEHSIDLNDSNSTHKLPIKTIGIIPAGSTDAAAYGTTGINDVVTSALQIALGRKLNIDVLSVHNGEKFLNYCTTLLGYGYFGDVAYESSKLRWMGPFRYNFTGFKCVLRNKSYHAKLRIKHVKNESPIDDSQCISNCKTCLDSKTTVVHDCSETNTNSIELTTTVESSTTATTFTENNIQVEQQHEQQTSNNFAINECNLRPNEYTNRALIEDSNNNNNNTNDLNNNNNNNKINSNLDGIDELLLNDVSDVSSGPFKRFVDCKEIEGEFLGINCVNMPCRCAKSRYGISSACHLSNGCADLVLVKKTGRFNYIKYLLSLSKKPLHTYSHYPFLETYRLQELEFTVPENVLARRSNVTKSITNFSKWNCDGEVIHDLTVKAKVHHQLLPIYGNGVMMSPTIDYE